MNRKGDSWIRLFDVSEPQLYPKGYTVYKISSTVFPKNSPEAATEVVVWKRFSDLKKLYKSLHALHSGLHLKGDFPNFPKSKVFGRFEPAIIEERRQSTLKLLEFVGQHPPLFTSQVFVKFFEGGRKNSVHSEEKKTDDIGKNDQVLCPVKVRNPAPVPGDGTVLSSNGDENPSLLGGVWQYPCSPDDVGLDSNEDDDDQTLEGDVASSDSPVNISGKSVLELFDPICPVPNDEEQLTDTLQEPRNSWLLSALASCTTSDDADSFLRRDPLEFPKAFEGFEEDGIGNLLLDQSSPAKIIDEGSGDAESKPSTSRESSPTVFERQSCNEEAADLLETGSSETSKDYLVNAARSVTCAQQNEVDGDLEGAFDHYRAAVGVLLSGVRDDLDVKRRAMVRRKIDRYLQRAEEISRLKQSTDHGDSLPVGELI